MKRKQLIVMAAVLLLVLLAGCRKEESEESKAGGFINLPEGITAADWENESPAGEEGFSFREDLPILRWAVYGDQRLSDEALEAVQALLADRGINCQLDVVPLSGIAEEYERNLEKAESDEGIFDLINTGMCFENYAAAQFAKKYLTELDSYLITEDGAEICKAIPEQYWRTVSIDGVHYTVPAPGVAHETAYFIAIRKDAAEQAAFDGTFEMLCDLFEKAQAESEEQMLLYMEDASDLVARLSGYQLIEEVLFDEKDNKFVSIAEAEELKKNIDQLHYWMGYGFLDGNKLSKPWIQLIKREEKVSDYEKCYAYIGFSEVPEELEQDYSIYWGEPVYVLNAVGMTNGISKKSMHKELAQKVLHLLYTDREFADLLVYGTKDSYTVEDGCIVQPEGNDAVWTAYCLGLFAQVTPTSTEGIKNRMAAVQEHMPSEEYFRLAEVLYDENYFTQEQLADSTKIYDYLSSWMYDK